MSAEVDLARARLGRMRSRAGLVDDVDGLVRQEAVVDVLGRELGRRLERLGVYVTLWCSS
jgi:hypothetical protein